MKKVFAKTSGIILSTALLCSTIPAMALKPDSITGIFAAKETASKVAPSFFRRAIAAIPSWKATKDVVATLVKKGAALVKDHRIAAIGGVLTAATIVAGYKLGKYLKSSSPKAALYDACVKARTAFAAIKDEASYNKARAAAEQVAAITCDDSCKTAQNAFIRAINALIRQLTNKQPMNFANMDRIIASLAPQAAVKPAAQTPDVAATPSAQNAQQEAATDKTVSKPAPLSAAEKENDKLLEQQLAELKKQNPDATEEQLFKMLGLAQ